MKLRTAIIFLICFLIAMAVTQCFKSYARPEITPAEKQEILRQHDEKVKELLRLQKEYKESLELYYRYLQGKVRLA